MSETPIRIALIGLPGSGKTAAGRALSRRLGWDFVDTDELVAAASGESVAAIFAREGETGFRARELAALESVAGRDGNLVLSTGGGLVTSPPARALLADQFVPVWLQAEVEVVAGRLAGDSVERPLLAAGLAAGSSPVAVLTDLAAAREPLYRELAACTVEAGRLDPEQVAAQVCTKLGLPGPTWGAAEVGLPPPQTESDPLVRVVEVELGLRSYPIVVAAGALSLLKGYLPPSARRAAVVTQREIPATVETGLDQLVCYVPQGEGAKAMSQVEELCRQFARFGLTRADVVVAVGGGVVTDLAGFAAASYHRGVGLVNCPTTLLGQVDAAIGGKTGVNLPEGKNLVGAFWQPGAVLCDIDVLSSLPEREWRCGFGEMAKYAFLGGDGLERWPLLEQVARSAAIKARVVSSDELEGGRRATLNYGHTLAHALEAMAFTRPDVDLPHGVAVAIGLEFAAHLAHRLGRIGEERVAYHQEVLSRFNLSSEIPPWASIRALTALMARDKKALTGLTFALDGPDGVEVVANIEEAIVVEVLRRRGCPE